MRKILIVLIVLTSLSCKSQIIPQNNAYVDIPEGAYIKDTQNFLDNFVGTWQYQNGNEQFTITFAKVLHNNNDSWYEDILIGEYKYVNPNGVTLVNTIADMTNNNFPGPLYHNIVGATSLVRLQYPPCPECNIGEFRIKCYFYDPDREYQNLAIVLRSISPTQISVKVFREEKSTFFNNDFDAPDDLRIPAANYTMNKI
jgi:hypothetical protein